MKDVKIMSKFDGLVVMKWKNKDTARLRAALTKRIPCECTCSQTFHSRLETARQDGKTAAYSLGLQIFDSANHLPEKHEGSQVKRAKHTKWDMGNSLEIWPKSLRDQHDQWQMISACNQGLN